MPNSLDALIAFTVSAAPFANPITLALEAWACKSAEEKSTLFNGWRVLPTTVPPFALTTSPASFSKEWPNGKQAVFFWTQTKTVTARWFDDSSVSAGVNTTISLK